MLVLAAALLAVGLVFVGVFVRQPLRVLLRAKDAGALERWRCAPVETRATIRRAWQRGAAVEDRSDALLAIEMAQHNDSVVEATNRVSRWSCLPVLPGIVLLLTTTDMPREIWLLILVPIALVVATYPLAVRSRTRRRRSIELTKPQHSLT